MRKASGAQTPAAVCAYGKAGRGSSREFSGLGNLWLFDCLLDIGKADRPSDWGILGRAVPSISVGAHLR